MDKSNNVHKKKIDTLSILIVYCFLIAVGFVAIRFEINTFKHRLKNNYVKESELIANSIVGSDLLQLTSKKTDTSLAVYKRIKQQLEANVLLLSDFRFVYIIGKHNDSLYYLFNDKIVSPKETIVLTGDTAESTASIITAFASHKKQYKDLHTNKRGKWFSSYIPIINHKTGAVVAVLGVGVSTSQWENESIENSAFSLLLIIGVLVSIAISISFVVISINRKQKAEIKDTSEEFFRFMFSSHKAIMLLLEPRTGNIIDVNNAAIEFYGYTKEELCSMNINQINCLSQDDVFKAINKAVSGDNKGFEFQHKLSNGEIRIVEVQSSTIEMRKGSFLFSIIKDITSRKKLEEESIIAQQNFESIYKTIPDPIVIMRASDGVITNVNDQFVKSSGYTREELIGHTSADFTAYADSRDREEALKALKDKGVFYNKSVRFITKNNTTVDCIISSKITILNKIAHVITTLRDVTEFKAIESKLIESNNLTQSLLQTIPFGMNIVDMNGTILFMSDSLKLQVGENIESKKCWELYHDDKKQCKECPLITGIEIAETKSCESYGIFGGKIFQVVQTGMIFENKRAILEIFIDITEQKHTELEKQRTNEQLSTLMYSIEQSPVTTVITDFKGDIEYVNPKFTEITGYTAEEVIGKNPRMLKTDYLSKEAYQELWDTILSGNNWQGIFQNKKKNGEFYWESAKISPVKDEHGTISHFLAVKEDITERKKTEDELYEANKAAVAANKAKSEFLATMSHEIRTPLNGVIGFSEILQKTKLNDQQREYIKNVTISANTLLDLVNDILDFSKIESGKLDLNYEKINLIEMSENIVDIMRYKISEKGIEMLLNISSKTPRFIIADPIRLRQILINLMGNAIKFTYEGEIEFKIEALPIPDNNLEMDFTFSIRDTGIGIPRNKQQAIFESFSQADSSINRKFGGTGLGLSISSNLVEKMGSHLQLESEEGVGSCFYFTIRLECEQYEEEDGIDLRGIKKVLIIDDNSSSRTILKSMLQTKKIEVELASNGVIAMEMIEMQKDYDIILVDYSMPYLNGLQVIRNIRQIDNNNEQKIIVIHNTLDDDTIKKECGEYNVKFILQKPIHQSQLYRTLSKIMSNSEVDEKSFEVEDLDIAISNSERHFKVLIVDDNQMNLNLVASLIALYMPNVEIVKTKEGKEASELYISEKPDIILLDVQMPVMNGYEVAREIRATVNDYRKRVPIIALTAGTVLGEKDRCIAAGMDDYLSKPLNSKSLFMAFDKYLFGNSKAELSTVPTVESKLVHFDKEEILHTYDNDEQVLTTFLDMAFNAMPQCIADMKDAIDEHNSIQIKFNAHTLKGMARGICFNILAEYASKLEKSSELGSEQCNEFFSMITTEFEYLKKEYEMIPICLKES